MRVALGAGRGRLVRQCLTESSVLALSGGALGVLLAAAGLQPFLAFWPGTLPRAEEAHLDWRVLLFAVAVSLFSGILFGIAPVLRAPYRDLEQCLRPGSRTIAGGSRRLHSAFIISEVALAIVLLSAAGMLGRTLLRLSALDPGVNIQNVLVSRMALSPATLQNPDRARAAWQDVLVRARAIPGVSAVTLVDTVPLRDGNNQQGYWPSADLPDEGKMPLALTTSVMPDYLQVVGIPLRAGRFFDNHDRIDSEPVIVIDEELARHAFPGQDPLGKRLWMPGLLIKNEPRRIVGVVGHVRYWGLASDDQAQVRDQVYYPFAQVPDELVRRWSELMSIIVRTDVQPLSLVDSLREELRGASGDQVLYEVRTLEQLARASLAQQRFLLLLFSIFAALALVLAAIGIYGVLAYLTSQRIPEIGLRMALGARVADVRWLVLSQSLTMVAFGAVFGIAAAWAAARILVRLVDGMRSTEPSTFLVVIPVLIAAALFAAWVPAHRASRVDPVIALRHE
jgi:predicted permease